MKDKWIPTGGCFKFWIRWWRKGTDESHQPDPHDDEPPAELTDRSIGNLHYEQLIFMMMMVVEDQERKRVILGAISSQHLIFCHVHHSLSHCHHHSLANFLIFPMHDPILNSESPLFYLSCQGQWPSNLPHIRLGNKIKCLSFGWLFSLFSSCYQWSPPSPPSLSQAASRAKPINRFIVDSTHGGHSRSRHV